MTKHKLADVIIAWASGESIQCRFSHLSREENRIWEDFKSGGYCVPNFDNPILEWRVKPKIKTEMKLTKVTKHFYNGKGEFCSPHFKFEGVTGSLQLSERPIESYTEEEKNEIYLSLGKSLVEQLQQLVNDNEV